jgi:hypothetical protein
MAKLGLRGAKGTGGKKSKAKAAKKGGRRGGGARGGIPYSDSGKGGGNADFNFGARSF